MAKFNPADAVPADDNQVKFNPADAVPVDESPSFLRSTAQGFGDTAKGFASGLVNTASALTDGLIPQYNPQGGGFNTEVGKIASSFIPGVGAEKGAATLLQGAEKLTPFVKNIISGATGGAFSAPAVGATPQQGATVGAIAAPVAQVLPKVIPTKKNIAKLLVGDTKNVTPEQFQAARSQVPDGIKAPIGELANSPRAKDIYGLTKGVIFSGANKPYQQLYNHLADGVQGLTKDAHATTEPNQLVYDDLLKSYGDAKAGTNQAYSDLANYADANNVPFDRTALDKQIDSSLDEIGKANKNKTTAKLYGDAIDTLNDYKQTPLNTFTDATDVRPALNDLIRKAAGSGEDGRVLLRHLQKIKTGLDNSIEDSAEQNPELMNLHDQAKAARQYQGTFEKLNNRDLSPFYKIYAKNGSPDNLIGSYLRTSNQGSDYGGLLSNLTDKLSPQARATVAKTYLDPRNEDNLGKSLTKLGKLSPTQRGLLFGDNGDTANQLDALSKLFPQSKSADFTPKTGFTGSKILQGDALLRGSLSPASLAAKAIPSTLARGLQRGLRSEMLKDAYLKYLQGVANKPRTINTTLSSALRTPVIASQGGNNG